MFFAVHLFKEQIFSMSDHLERIIKQFLKVNRCECCFKQKQFREEVGDWPAICMARKVCFFHGQCIKLVKVLDNKGNKITVDEDTRYQLHRDWIEPQNEYYLQAGTSMKMFKEKEECLSSKITPPAQIKVLQKIKDDIKFMNEEVERMKIKNQRNLALQSKEERRRIETEMYMDRRKKYMLLRVMEMLVNKFNDIRREQTRIRFDRISHQLLRFFTHDQDVPEIKQDEKGAEKKDEDGDDIPKAIPRTISFREIMRVYPNAETITFVNRHLDGDGHNTSCLNGLVIKSLLHEMKREREKDETPKKCPLRKVVFTYYDYEGDIFEENEKLWTGDANKEKGFFVEDIVNNKDNEQRKLLEEAGWRLKNHKIGSGYKVRIEKR